MTCVVGLAHDEKVERSWRDGAEAGQKEGRKKGPSSYQQGPCRVTDLVWQEDHVTRFQYTALFLSTL